MSSFDPMAAAIDWFDFYRSASLSIVDLYSDSAALECCAGDATLYGRAAISEYWRQRFTEMPAGELEDLQQVEKDAIVVSYRVSGEIAQASLFFDREGKIAKSFCGLPH